MSKKFVYMLEQKSKFNVDQNFLQFYPNFSFTSPQLRQKRLLAFLFKKLILTSKNDQLTAVIITHLLSVMKREHSICEEQLLDILESLLLKYPHGKEYCKKVVDTIVTEYDAKSKTTKKSKKQNELMRWYTVLLKDDSYDEMYHSLRNRIDQSLHDGSHTVLVFLLVKLAKHNNFEVLDGNFVSARMRTFNSREIYLINEYSKYLEDKFEYKEALDFLEKFRFSETDDNLALKKSYLRILLKTKTSNFVTEAVETLKKDPFDEKHSEILFECLRFLLKDEESNLKDIMGVLFEVLAVNRNKRNIWQKFAEFLSAFRNSERFDDYFAADKVGDFIKLHFDKAQLLNDAKEFIMVQKKRANTKIDHYGGGYTQGANNIMESKIQVIKALDNPNKAIQDYVSAYRKICSA